VTGARPPSETPAEIVAHYERYDESARLSGDRFGRLERLRTEQILLRELPPAPATVVDVGSGPGVYAVWLAERGYHVHAIDPVSRHIEQARERAARHGVRLASASVGDARRLDMAASSADVVLLMGPLYHLQERRDRLTALGEARRVLRSGGLVAAAAVGRFAPVLDGLARGFIDDPEFQSALETSLETGRHHNPTDDPNYFTTAYFHRPEHLAAEVESAGFSSVHLYAVEGIAWLAPDFEERLDDPDRRTSLLDLADRLAQEPALLGVSPHLLTVARKP
jgi:ubiquinone/menaquinone biosynthesis C-methylase UbiE